MQLSPTLPSASLFRQRPFWMAVLTSTILTLAVISAWVLLNDVQRRNVESLADHRNHTIEVLIRQDLSTRITAIEMLAQHWMASDGTPPLIWKEEAFQYLTRIPGIQAIEWADATQHLQWVVPQEGNESGESQHVPPNAPFHIGLSELGEHAKPSISHPFECVPGSLSIRVYVPVTREEKFDGVMVGILSLKPLLNAVLTGPKSAEFQSQVFLATQRINGHTDGDDAAHEQWSNHHEFEAFGLQWLTKLAPTDELIAASRLRGLPLTLILGLILSVLFGLVVGQWLASRARSNQLKALTDQLSTLMQNLPGMVYCTLNHRDPWPMQFVSEGCKTLCGYEQRDFEENQLMWRELIHPDDREQAITTVRNAFEHEENFEVLYRICTKGGMEKWVLERGRRAYSPSNRQYDLVGFISDITELKLSELRIAQEQAYSKAIVDTALEAVITINTDGTIDSFNHAAESMFNYSLEEVLGKNVRLLMPQPFRDEHDQYIRHYLDTDEARIIGTGRRVNGQREDGSVFPIHLSISEIQDQNTRMFVALIRDISQEKVAADQARLQREQLAHVDRLHLLGEMATGIAHEINQPLTSISLFAQAGKRFLDIGAFERLPNILDKLIQHALRAGSIIEQMQLMTRQRESKKTLIDCNSLIGEIRQLAEAEARIHDINIKVDISKDLPRVFVDEIQIQQVALNLLRNGMEAMRSIECRNGDTIQLLARLRKDGDVVIKVIDSGSGVSPDIAAKLFTPFSTTKDSGMGMGLSISRTIVVAHGGQLDLVNNEAGGAEFSFNLPAAKQGEKDE